MAFTLESTAKIAVHNAFVTLLDTGAGNAQVDIYDDSATPVKLGEIILADPCGTVNGTTGQLTLNVLTQEDSALASGTISYVEVLDVSDTLQLTVEAIESATAVSGYAAFDDLAVVIGTPISALSLVIG